MPSADELRAELRALRRESKAHKPISKMGKKDVAEEIERLRGLRETTAPVASVPGASKKVLKAASESIKDAKREEFPVAPTKKEAVAAPKKARPSKAALRAMLDELSSDEE